MFDEYDYVELTKDLDSTLRAGTRGAIMMIYQCSPPEYEVEFVDKQGNTIAFRTVEESQLTKVNMANENVT